MDKTNTVILSHRGKIGLEQYPDGQLFILKCELWERGGKSYFYRILEKRTDKTGPYLYEPATESNYVDTDGFGAWSLITIVTETKNR